MKSNIIINYFRNINKIPLSLPLFISALTNANHDDINKYCAEFKLNTRNYNLSKYHEVLYIITRILKPDTIIETGVFEGCSSLTFLIALNKNNKGLLYSIDLPSSKLLPGNEPGWIVPAKLYDRWDLRKGKSECILPNLLDEINKVDIFLHDSDHSYTNMFWEFKTVCQFVREGGLVLSHDVSQNAAFRDFANSISKKYYYMLKNCGGIKQ